MIADEKLRASGVFEIHARPANGPPMWRAVDGRIFTQAAALALIEGNGVEALRLKQAARKRHPLRADG